MQINYLTDKYKSREQLLEEVRELRLENKCVRDLAEQDNTSRTKACQSLFEYNAALTKLNQFSIELSGLSFQDNLEALIIKRVKEFTGAKVAMFSNYDPVNRITTTEYIETEPGLLDKFLATVTNRGTKLRVEINDDMYRHITKEVIGIRKSLNEISFGSIPRPVGDAIQSIFRVDRFIGLSFLIEGNLYGTALLGMDKDQPDPQMQILENFVFQASVSLRRRQAEEERNKTNELLRRITSQVPGAVCLFRLYPDGRSAFPFASAGMFDMYEVMPDEVREDAKIIFERHHPDDIGSIVENMRKSARNLTIYQQEYRVILPEKGLCWRMCRAKPIPLDDGSVLYYGIVTDTTMQKAMEMELVEAKVKAEESDRLKSAFLANISHEIRTPMNGILGFAELLKEPGLNSENIHHYVDMIEKSGTRLLNVINQIISISRIESGQVDQVSAPVNLYRLIESLYFSFLPEASAKGLTLLVDYSGLPDQFTINTDPDKLEMILTNLINNAIKFTGNGSVTIGCTKDGDFVEFFVQDTGIGIDPKDIEFIFERFRHSGDFLNRSHQGAGLGLSISKGYIKLLGGNIRVKSTPKQGSTFYFTIPVGPVYQPRTDTTIKQARDQAKTGKLKATTISKSLNLNVMTSERSILKRTIDKLNGAAMW